MARALNQLSAVKVARIRDKGLYLDGGGLYLSVSRTGSKSWIFRFRRRDMGLGSYPAISLAGAREKAAKAREMLAHGEDPIEVRRGRGAANKAMSFTEAAEIFIKAREKALAAVTARKWRKRLDTHIPPAIGRLPLAAIEVRHVLEILEPIWWNRNPTAAMVRNQIELILDWAKAKELRKGENPARWRGHLEHLLTKRKQVHSTVHHPALPYIEIPTFMTELRNDDSIGARALEFQILTAVRPGEALGARWSEIQGDVWTVPAERTKKRKTHRIPLSKAAMALLAGLPRLSDCVFPGIDPKRPICITTLRKPAKRLACDVTAHGFRSAFRDWVAEATPFPAQLAEMALAHIAGDKTMQAYMRTDLFEKRRDLMNAWANFCEHGAREAEIIPLFTKT
jgi:integrase